MAECWGVNPVKMSQSAIPLGVLQTEGMPFRVYTLAMKLTQLKWLKSHNSGELTFISHILFMIVSVISLWPHSISFFIELYSFFVISPLAYLSLSASNGCLFLCWLYCL